jgi:hypothetical protein
VTNLHTNAHTHTHTHSHTHTHTLIYWGITHRKLPLVKQRRKNGCDDDDDDDKNIKIYSYIHQKACGRKT